MDYAQRILQPGEAVAYRARLHWILMARGGAVLLLAAVFSLGAWFADAQYARVAWLALAAILAVAGVFDLLRGWVRRISTEIIVTNRRIILKTGLVGRQTIEMNLDKVESVLVRQGVMGRLLDFGTIIIRGVGAGLEPIANLAAPLEFHRYVNAVP
jgi:uncharacterized membrane protein YdbT with pleckstrin-like domain